CQSGSSSLATSRRLAPAHPGGRSPPPPERASQLPRSRGHVSRLIRRPTRQTRERLRTVPAQPELAGDVGHGNHLPEPWQSSEEEKLISVWRGGREPPSVGRAREIADTPR